MRNVKLIFIVFSMLVATSHASESIIIPCQDYHVGDIMTIMSKSQNQTVTMTNLVEYVDDYKVTLTSKQDSNSGSLTIKEYLIKKNNGYYKVKGVTDIGGMKVVNEYDPPIPLCGNIDVTFKYKTKINNGFGYALGSITTVRLELIGEENVDFLIGRRFAKIIKRTEETRIDMGNAIPTENVSLSYIVNKLGEIKRVSTMKQRVPKYNLPNKDIENFFNKNMQDMNSSNIADKLKKMKEVINESDSNTGFTENNISSTWEVIKYQIKNR